MQTEMDMLQDIKEARISARLSKMKHHEQTRAQTSCSFNSYIKPKNLTNFSVDYSTFERFQKIKNSIAEQTISRHFICQEMLLSNWVPEPRENASLLCRKGDNQLYLFGGIC